MLRLSEAILGAPGDAVLADFAAAHDEMRVYLEVLVDERRARPRDDLLSALAHADAGGERLTGDEILGFFQLLLLAGHETTTNLIANAVLCLCEHPDALTRLREPPAMLPAFLEEVLRYRSPVQAAFRVTRRDAELGGRTIPAGRMVLPMIGSANRDPARFANANAFEIARDPNPHLAFGHGIHHCIGAPLARLEGRVALAELLREWAWFDRADAVPWTPREALHVHGPAALGIRFEPSPVLERA